MATAGAKPKPTNVHVLNGNPGHKAKHQLKSSINPDVKIPTCPKHLSAEAKTEWKRISVELEKLGIISQIDLAALAIYCQAYGRWVQSEVKIKELNDLGNYDGFFDETPNGYKQISVWMQISNRAVDQMRRMLPEFGMTPSARSRIRDAQTVNSDDGETKEGRGRFFNKK